MSKILIAYYSRKGQNYVNGSIKNLAKGNTEVVAEFVQKPVGGDLACPPPTIRLFKRKEAL